MVKSFNSPEAAESEASGASAGFWVSWTVASGAAASVPDGSAAFYWHPAHIVNTNMIDNKTLTTFFIPISSFSLDVRVALSNCQYLYLVMPELSYLLS